MKKIYPLALAFLAFSFCQLSAWNPVDNLNPQDDKWNENLLIWFALKGKDFDPDDYSHSEKEDLIKEVCQSTEGDARRTRLFSCGISDYFFKNQDYRRAFYWAEKGAELGCECCCNRIRFFYAKGYGCVKDVERAVIFAFIGASLGDEVCVKLIKLTEEQTDPQILQNIENARRKAVEWVEEHRDTFYASYD